MRKGRKLGGERGAYRSTLISGFTVGVAIVEKKNVGGHRSISSVGNVNAKLDTWISSPAISTTILTSMVGNLAKIVPLVTLVGRVVPSAKMTFVVLKIVKRDI
uniref:Uncharacterized protein n=1 Tax=Nelumbo nucifera TaxID=4432 RepID=A0A822ZGA4_NELNU|nr:TPA_asm: hypothetical protein HUJ06_000719 [Nelumbo nucifera]